MGEPLEKQSKGGLLSGPNPQTNPAGVRGNTNQRPVHFDWPLIIYNRCEPAPRDAPWANPIRGSVVRPLLPLKGVKDWLE